MAVGLLLFIALVPVAFLLSKPYYEVEGMLRIDPVIPTLLGPTEDFSITAYYHDYVRTQVNRIKQHSIIEKALRSLPEDIKKEFLIEGQPIKFAAKILAKRITVSQVRDTHLMRIVLGGEKPVGLAEIVNRMTDLFLDKLLEEEEGKNNKRLAFLEEEKERLEKQIAQKILLNNEIAKSAGTSTFSEMFNIVSRQLQDLQEAYTRAYGKRLDKENNLANLKRSNEALAKVSLEPLVDEMVERDESLWDTSFWTYKNLQELRASIDGVTADNPDRKYIDDRMKGMKDYLSKLREDVRKRAKRIIYQKRDVELQQKLIVAQADFQAAKDSAEALKKERDKTKVAASEITSLILQGQQVQTELGHFRALLDRTNDRIHALKLESRAPGRVRLEIQAHPPTEPSGNNRNKFLALFFMFAFGSMTATAVIYDLLDNRIHKVMDIENALGFPPTWPISDYKLRGRKNVDFYRVVLEDPEHVVAKAIRSLAVRNDKERRKHGAKVAIFTGVDDKSGVTGILLNMAQAMSGLCKRVLVIEANPFSPCLAEYFDLDPQTGFFDILAGETDKNNDLTIGNQGQFDLITAGECINNGLPAKFDYSRLASLFEELREKYDYILVDSAPILISDITEYLTVYADVGMLVVHGDRSTYSNLRFAVKILSRLELPTMAAVLNWGCKPKKSQLKIMLGSEVLDKIKNK